MKKLLDKISEVKPNKILVTGTNKLFVNKFSHELTNILNEIHNKNYSCIFNEENFLVEKFNETIKDKKNIIISATNLLHVADLIDVNLIVFVDNNHKVKDEIDNKYKQLILNRVKEIGEPLTLDYFNCSNIYKLRLKFFEYWIMPSLLFDVNKNTFIIKEYEIKSPDKQG